MRYASEVRVDLLNMSSGKIRSLDFVLLTLMGEFLFLMILLTVINNEQKYKQSKETQEILKCNKNLGLD